MINLHWLWLYMINRNVLEYMVAFYFSNWFCIHVSKSMQGSWGGPCGTVRLAKIISMCTHLSSTQSPPLDPVCVLRFRKVAHSAGHTRITRTQHITILAVLCGWKIAKMTLNAFNQSTTWNPDRKKRIENSPTSYYVFNPLRTFWMKRRHTSTSRVKEDSLDWLTLVSIDGQEKRRGMSSIYWHVTLDTLLRPVS